MLSETAWERLGLGARASFTMVAMKSIELSKQARAEAIASLRRYFEDNLTEPIGDLQAGLLLNYVLEEIGPAVYNQAISDAQAQLTARVSDLSGELYADEFQYWPRQAKKKRR